MEQSEEILDIGWYDGVTEALVRTCRGQWMYAALVACSLEKGRRIYALVEADNSLASQIRKLAVAGESSGGGKEERWAELRGLVRQVLHQAEGPAELRLCDDLGGDQVSTLGVGARDAVAAMVQQLEDAFDEARYRRFATRFGEAP